MKKELLVKTLKFLKEEPELTEMTLNDIEQRFYHFESFIIQLIEDALQDKEDVKVGTLTTWWLYDSCPKQVWETTNTSLTPINLESAEDFVNYMTQRNEQ